MPRKIRAIVMRLIVRALAARPQLLARGMRYFAVRKLLGVDARIRALRVLGATIGDEVFIGARVWIRNAANLTIGDGTSLNGAVTIESWQPVVFGKDVQVNGDVAFLTGGHDIHSPMLAPPWPESPSAIMHGYHRRSLCSPVAISVIALSSGLGRW